jgi:[NiFe] hydrogenase assembly HybE family chaperone
MNDAAKIAAKFEETFEHIRVERMEGVPILNPALSVEMTELVEWETWHAGVLVTPWFINLMLIARGKEVDQPITGTKKLFNLPAGVFEFIRSEEEGLGGFWMCSLFSPALEFGDQETAMAVADASFATLMNEEENEGEPGMERIWRGELPREETPDTLAEGEMKRDDREDSRQEVSRRAFLTAGRRQAGTTRGDAT